MTGGVTVYWRLTPIIERPGGMQGATFPATFEQALDQATKWACQIGGRVRLRVVGHVPSMEAIRLYREPTNCDDPRRCALHDDRFELVDAQRAAFDAGCMRRKAEADTPEWVWCDACRTFYPPESVHAARGNR